MASPNQIIENAFQKLKLSINTSDAKSFSSTCLEEVYEAARIIERDQEQRRCLRNLRKIEPLLGALKKLGIAIDVLCQGTPFMSFAWVYLSLQILA